MRSTWKFCARAALILVVAAFGVGRTDASVPNPSFEQDVVGDGSTVSPPTGWFVAGGTPSNAAVWNPTSADFSTAGGNGVLPGTAQGSQCFTNVATTWSNDVDVITSPSTPVCTLVADREYTVTVSLGSPSSAKIYDGQSIGFIDISAGKALATHDDIFPAGRDWSNMKGCGTFGDISFTIKSNDFIGKNGILAGQNLGVVLD